MKSKFTFILVLIIFLGIYPLFSSFWVPTKTPSKFQKKSSSPKLISELPKVKRKRKIKRTRKDVLIQAQKPRSSVKKSFWDKVQRAQGMAQFPKDYAEWDRHYWKEYNKLPLDIQAKLTHLMQKNPHKTQSALCKKGYLLHCIMAAQHLPLIHPSLIESYPQSRKQLNLRYKLLTIACKGYTDQACKELMSLYNQYLLPEQKVEVVKLILQLCEKGWAHACETYAFFLHEQGNQKQALAIAKNTCEKLGICHMAGMLLQETDPEASAEYLLKDCLNRKEHCGKFLTINPNHERSGEALDIMVNQCRESKVIGYNECLSLANALKEIDLLSEAQKILKMSCNLNPAACVHLGFQSLETKNSKEAYFYFEKACHLARQLNARDISREDLFCEMVSAKNLAPQDFQKFEYYPIDAYFEEI